MLGVFGDPAETGKPAGDDLREGKRTYLVATAFALRRRRRTRTIMRQRSRRPALDDAGVARLREIIDVLGRARRDRGTASPTSPTPALTALAKVPLANGADDVLTELVEAAVRRRR